MNIHRVSYIIHKMSRNPDCNGRVIHYLSDVSGKRPLRKNKYGDSVYEE